jgi:hypothetical protein
MAATGPVAAIPSLLLVEPYVDGPELIGSKLCSLVGMDAVIKTPEVGGGKQSTIGDDTTAYERVSLMPV